MTYLSGVQLMSEGSQINRQMKVLRRRQHYQTFYTFLKLQLASTEYPSTISRPGVFGVFWYHQVYLHLTARGIWCIIRCICTSFTVLSSATSGETLCRNNCWLFRRSCYSSAISWAGPEKLQLSDIRCEFQKKRYFLGIFPKGRKIAAKRQTSTPLWF